MFWNIITTVVATLGFILACISLGWQVWTYHRSHKEDIRGTLSIGGKVLEPGNIVIGLFLDIWNNGKVPVYIKSVALTWGDEGPKIGNTLFAFEFKEYPPQKGPLQPGDGMKYVLPCLNQNLLSKASEQPAGKVWVSVKSQTKEVLRLQGDDLKVYLAKLINVPNGPHVE
jgi:hypothetical protein